MYSLMYSTFIDVEMVCHCLFGSDLQYGVEISESRQESGRAVEAAETLRGIVKVKELLRSGIFGRCWGHQHFPTFPDGDDIASERD